MNGTWIRDYLNFLKLKQFIGLNLWYGLEVRICPYIVDCRGIMQLEALVQGSPLRFLVFYVHVKVPEH